jgi:hypothetical protein
LRTFTNVVLREREREVRLWRLQQQEKLLKFPRNLLQANLGRLPLLHVLIVFGKLVAVE